MELNNFLIGCRLYDITDEYLAVIHPEMGLIRIDIEQDDGDCCGYACVDTSLLIKPAELERNPVITNVEYIENEGAWTDEAIITLFGESNKLAEIQAECGSGSGWAYGACVSIACKLYSDINDCLCSW